MLEPLTFELFVVNSTISIAFAQEASTGSVLERAKNVLNNSPLPCHPTNVLGDHFKVRLHPSRQAREHHMAALPPASRKRLKALREPAPHRLVLWAIGVVKGWIKHHAQSGEARLGMVERQDRRRAPVKWIIRQLNKDVLVASLRSANVCFPIESERSPTRFQCPLSPTADVEILIAPVTRL